MVFLTSKDWLNRQGPYGFMWDHLLFVFFFLILGFGLAIYLIKKDKKVIKIVCISLWAFSVLLETVYYGFVYGLCLFDPVNFPFTLESHLPLHSCNMFMYIFPFAMFSKNKTIKTAANSFLVIVNMIMGFITLFVGCPAKGYSALSFTGLQSIIYHSIIVIVPFIMVITNYYDVQFNDYRYGLALFGILAFSMWIFDFAFHCDYFFIYDGRTFGVLYEISENVPHLVWTLITVSCYIITALIIHFLIIYIKRFIQKKNEKKESI